MRAVAVVLLGCMLGGCFGAGAPPAECVWDRMVATPKVDGLYMQTDPRQTWQTVVRSPADNDTVDVTLAWSAAAGWTASSRSVSPQEPLLQVLTVEPGGGAGNATLDFEVHTHDGPCQDRQRGSVAWDFAVPKEGVLAGPGQGAHVMTAGFLENGTLFYTNIADIDADGRWPRTPWYSWEGDAPLPVYVYGDARDEQPGYWMSPSGNAPPLPSTGTPLDRPVGERVNATLGEADHTTGLGYFTTIAGFNEGLKGLSTTTTRVVHIAPEDAYTRPGYEEHDLYGEAVVFVIKILDVVDLPCPTTLQVGNDPVGVPQQGCTTVI